MFLVEYLQNLQVTTVGHTMVANCTTATVATTHIVVVDANTHHCRQITLHHLGNLLNFTTVDIVAAGPFTSFTFDWTSTIIIADSFATSLITFKITASLYLYNIF